MIGHIKVAFTDNFRANAESLVQVLRLLIRSRSEDSVDETRLADRLPEWLLREFSPKKTPEEKLEWLQRWRSASHEEQLEMERSAGWELTGWLHWFSAGNDLWRLRSADVDDVAQVVDIELDQVDDPVPIEAVEWLVGRAGLTVAETDVSR
ncbi:hypothetical protein [Nonomuraea rubra]|uniref:hypothetical protein n=1 Tax=Nonomuraea rubra TaxID=46180 RepID=UPI003408B773